MAQRQETSHAVQDKVWTVDYTDRFTNIHLTVGRMAECIQAVCLTAWPQLQRGRAATDLCAEQGIRNGIQHSNMTEKYEQDTFT